MTNKITLQQISKFEAAISNWNNTPPEGVSPSIHQACYDGLESILESLRAELARSEATKGKS